MFYKNYSRELCNYTISKICTDCLFMKEDEFKELIKKSNNVVYDIVSISYRKGTFKKLQEYFQSLLFALDFDGNKHFYISNDNMFKNNKELKDLFVKLGDKYFVEIDVCDITLLCHFYKVDNLSINDDSVVMKSDVFMITDCPELKDNSFLNPIMSIWFSSDLEHYYLQLHKDSYLMRGCVYSTEVLYDSIQDELMDINLITQYQNNINELCSYIASYIFLCLANIDNRRRNKKIKCDNINIIGGRYSSNVDTSINFVKFIVPPLSLEKDVKQSKSENGYYRKSSGKGDYDLISGEFIFVGRHKGSYSYVNRKCCKDNK